MTLTCITFDPLIANLAVAGVVTVLVVDEPVELRGRFGIAAGPLTHEKDENDQYHVTFGDWPLGDGFALLNLDGDLCLDRHVKGKCDHRTWVDVHTEAIVGSGVIEDCVPIVNHAHADVCLAIYRTRMVLWHGDEGRDLSDQLPYQQFTPGRYALIVSDVKPTTERCPACWGSGEHGQEPCVGCSCSTCEHDGICPPIPVPGKSGAWEWTP